MSIDLQDNSVKAPKTTNYKKLVLEWKDAEKLILAAGTELACRGFHINGPESPRLMYGGGSAIRMLHARSSNALIATIHKGERDMTLYNVYAGRDLTTLRGYTPVTSEQVKRRRGGRRRQNVSDSISLHGSSLGWMLGECKHYLCDGMIGTHVEDNFRAGLNSDGVEGTSRLFRRAVMSAYSEARALSDMFPSVLSKPKMLTGPKAGSKPYMPGGSILLSLKWRQMAYVELCVPVLHHNTAMYIYVCSDSRIVAELKSPLYVAAVDYRMSSYDQGNDPLHGWCCKHVQAAEDHILASSACLDDILDVCREWCAASVDIPA